MSLWKEFAKGVPSLISLTAGVKEIARRSWSDLPVGSIFAVVPKTSISNDGKIEIGISLTVQKERNAIDNGYLKFGLRALRLRLLPRGAFDQAAALGDAHRDRNSGPRQYLTMPVHWNFVLTLPVCVFN